MVGTALVLSGGGYAGGAWMLGLIAGMRAGGVDLGAADLVVGTSAGGRTGAILTTGLLDRAVSMHRSGALPRLELPATLPDFLAAVTTITAEAKGDQLEAARRIANLEPLGDKLVEDADRRRVIAEYVPVREWPARRLVITAVDAADGRRVTFDASSGVALHDALAATSALPGLFPLAPIDGGLFADGGLSSPYNADLAAGCDSVTVLSPLPVNVYLRRLLEAETAALGDAHVRVIVADQAALAAIGPDSLSIDAAPAALEAGMAQAGRELG
jgi:NTE family protein